MSQGGIQWIVRILNLRKFDDYKESVYFRGLRTRRGLQWIKVLYSSREVR